MKNIYDVLRQKELEIERVKEEIEALRAVAPLLEDREAEPIATPTATAKPYYSTQQKSEPVHAADTGMAARVWP